MIEMLLAVLALYLALGLAFALVFHGAGLKDLDPGVSGAGWFFRLLITPGLVALWPVLAWKWRRRARGQEAAGRADAPVPPEVLRSLHEWLVALLILVIPLLVVVILFSRPPRVTMLVPQLIQEPSPLEQLLWQKEETIQGTASHWTLRGHGEARQIEVRIAGGLALPSLGLYWAPADGPGVPAGSVFLGALSGLGEFRFDLPSADKGVLVVHSLARGEGALLLSLPDTAAAAAEPASR